MHKELLEEIRNKANCSYISDLRRSKGRFLSETAQLALESGDGEFSMREWNEAISYMSGVRAEFEDIGSLRAYLNRQVCDKVR